MRGLHILKSIKKQPIHSILLENPNVNKFKIRLTVQPNQYLNIYDFNCYDINSDSIKLTDPKLSSTSGNNIASNALDNTIGYTSMAHTLMRNPGGEYFEATINSNDLNRLACIVIHNRTGNSIVENRLDGSKITVIANDKHYPLVYDTEKWTGIRSKYFAMSAPNSFVNTYSIKV